MPKEKYERLILNLSTVNKSNNVTGDNTDVGKIDEDRNTKNVPSESIVNQQGAGAAMADTKEVNDVKEIDNGEKSNLGEEDRMDVDENDGQTKIIKMSPEVFFKRVEKMRRTKKGKSKWLNFKL